MEEILQNMGPLTFHPGSFHPLELGSGTTPRWNSCRAAHQLVSNLPSHYKPPSRRSNPDLRSRIFDVLYPIKRIFVSRPPPFQMFFFFLKAQLFPLISELIFICASPPQPGAHPAGGRRKRHAVAASGALVLPSVCLCC